MLPDTENAAFTFYNSFMQTARKFPKPERLALYEAIFDYAFSGTEPRFSGIDENMRFALNVAFGQIQASVATNLKRRADGAKGGAPKGNANAKGHGAPKGNSNAKKAAQNQTTNAKEDNLMQCNVIKLASYEAAPIGDCLQASPSALNPEPETEVERIAAIRQQQAAAEEYTRDLEQRKQRARENAQREITKLEAERETLLKQIAAAEADPAAEADCSTALKSLICRRNLSDNLSDLEKKLEKYRGIANG